MLEYSPTSASLPSSIKLDTQDMVITKEGVENYFWPVANSTREDFYDSLLVDLHTIFLDMGIQNRNLLPYKLWAKHLICETVGVFWADVLREGFKTAARVPDVPQHFRLWSSIFKEKIPDDSPVLTSLFRRPQESLSHLSRAKRNWANLQKACKLLSFHKNGLMLDGMHITPITKHLLEDVTIVTQRTPLIKSQVASTKEKFVYARSDRWYAEVSNAQAHSQMAKSLIYFEKKYLAAVNKNYLQHGGFSIPPYSRSYLDRFMSLGVAIIREHIERLEKKEVPKKIWTGSGGNLWDCMLRIECIKRGGTATGHDHGAGLGHVHNPYMGFLEFWGCDRFVTFNDNQAYALATDPAQTIFMDMQKPLITGPNGSSVKQKLSIFDKFTDKDISVKTIAIMADIYDGDRGRGGPYGPDIMYADWQARLAGKLSEWGYKAILKIHPESKTLPPPAMHHSLHARLERRPIEKLLNDVDLVLFDCLYTTAFRSIISTNIPMVFVDFYGHPWTQNGLDLVKKRSGFVNAGYDINNKQHIDWETLKNEISKAPSLCNNTEFFDHYYA